MTFEEAHDEYSVIARLDGTKIVGDIDRLLVTPESYWIIDYKTNDLSATTSEELLDHYRPQLLAYALALLQHDSSRDVRASLRFTDAGVEESVEWSAERISEIEAELRSMLTALE